MHGVCAPSYPWRYGISLDQEEDWNPWNYSFSFWEKKKKNTNKQDPQDLGISLDHIELDTILITFEGMVKRFVGGHRGGVGLLYCVSSGTKISVSLNVCPFVGERGGGGAPVLCPQLDRDLCLSTCVPFMSVSDGWLRCLNTHKCSFLSKCYLNIIIHDVNDFQAPVGPYPFSLLQ